MIKVKMISNATIGKKNFAIGREYVITSGEYIDIKGSCKIKDKMEVETKNQEVKKIEILVIKSHGIGNLINVSPMIKILHDYYKVKIDLLCEEHVKEIYKGWDLVDVYVYPYTLPEKSYDIVIEGLPNRIDMVEILKKIKYKKILKGNMDDLKVIHEIEANIKIIEPLKIVYEKIPDTYIHISQEVKDRLNKEYKAKYIGVSSGCDKSERWKNKNWGYKNYADLIDLIKQDFKKHKILIFGTDEDGKVYKNLKNKKNVIDCVDRYTINESAHLISKCDFLVTNDTGLGHVAGAVGTKVYSIFGATSIIKNRPWGNSVVISKNMECSPCQFTPSKMMNCKADCMKIKPEEVYAQIEKLDKRDYELGIVISTYNRYEMLYNTLNQFLSCYDFENIKIAIVNDGSTDDRINKLLLDFQKVVGNKNKLEIVNHYKNYGKDRYGDTLKDSLKKLYNCKHILFMPDDYIFNRYLFSVIKKSYKYFTGTIKCITFVRDERYLHRKLYRTYGKVDKYFEYVTWVDGGLALYENEVINEFELKSENTDYGSRVWFSINTEFLKKYKIIVYKNCLAEHLGNLYSAMNTEIRKTIPIWCIDLKVFEKPEILEEK